MPVPELDDDARAAALEKAMRVRQLRAEVKLMLKSGEVTLADLLDRLDDGDPELVLGKMRVVDVLDSMPNIGRITAERIMQDLNISLTRRLKGLGPRQREGLLERFGDGA